MSSKSSIDPSAASLQAETVHGLRAGTEPGVGRVDGVEPAVADTDSASLQRPIDARQRAHSLRLRTGTLLAGGRLRVLRAIGAGGMGTVYEVEDLGSGEKLALKTLTRPDAFGVYQFKNEFRSIADLIHPNLVRLHELFAEDDSWFFTMELIAGESFDRWVRPAGVLDEPRLRSGLRQLCAGVAAIHAAGKLHRDLKPSNVLVTAEGRVAVLDLGLAVERAAGGVGQTLQDAGVCGTPAYMAPEQAAGADASPASDCYALGVLLFEAITGKLPFDGPLGRVLVQKQQEDAPRASAVVPDLPRDLEILCAELLARDPFARPDLAALQARLGALPEAALSASQGASEAPLVGREAELAALRAAHRATLSGRAVALVVSGESGIGKSAVCEAFLRELREHNYAVVLAGRCRERESVPFKAFDTVVDEVSRYLRRLPPERAATLLPRDAFALARLFPVLGRVPAIADAPVRDALDPHELRRRAFVAFGELLGRIRDRDSLVVCIDDLQWTDADSATFLRHLLMDRSPVPALFIAIHRNEAANSGLLSDVLEAAAGNPQLEVRKLDVAPLDNGDTERLARRLLAEQGADSAALSALIAREAGGSPFFAGELARFARAGHGAGQAGFSLAGVLLSRIDRLAPQARALLEVLALVGQPLAIDLAFAAGGAAQADLDTLRTAQLIRGRDAGPRKLVECYHDRIRESVFAALPEVRRTQHYGALARALTLRESGDHELLSTCLEGIGDHAGAAHCARLAAAEAAATMAFNRAVALFRRALTFGGYARSERLAILVELGSALENAGRGAEAAFTFLQAAELSAGAENHELRRRAAEQLLATGHIDEGTTLIKAVCAEVGVAFPSATSTAIVSYALSSVRLRLRSLDARELPSAAVRERHRSQLRAARTVVTGLIGYLPVHSAVIASRYLLMALDSGEQSDRIRGFGFNAYLQTLVDPTGRYASALLARMDALAARSGAPELLGFASLMKGTTAYHCDRFDDARGHLGRAIEALRGCPGVDWELDAANIYDQLTAYERGEYGDLARSTPPLIDEALRRGRVWAAAMLAGFAGQTAWLVPDDPAGYRTLLDEVRRHWHGRGQPHWPDYMLLVAESRLAMYRGDPAAAFELFDAHRGAYARSQLVKGAGIGSAGYSSHRGKCAVAALRGGDGAASGQRKRARGAVHDSLADLRRNGSAKSLGLAATLEAALALDAGIRGQAGELLRDAIAHLDAAGNAMLAAAARRRLGQLIGGDEGAALVATGDAFMRSHGVKNPEALTEVSCPGLRA